VNAPNLSRRLASRIVEGLKGRGRILVVKGETAALVRTLDDAMSGFVEPLAERIGRSPSLADDPTTHDALSRLTCRVARALLASEHLEDVFADRSVVEREVLDAARLALREASAAGREDLVSVELDLLGYVAATAGKRAKLDELVPALERAGRIARANLASYDPATREATFLPEPPIHPDLGLELEEAVADELCALVEQGVVELPTLERVVPLARALRASERTRLARVIDRAATHTLRRTGNAARWAIDDGKTLRVVYTPLSEQDARDVDGYVAAFAAEVNALLGEAATPLVSALAPAPLPSAPVAPPELPVAATEVCSDEPRISLDGDEPPERAAEEAITTEPLAAPKRARAAAKRAPRTSGHKAPSTRVSATRAATKKRTATKRPVLTTDEGARKPAKAATKKRAPASPTTKARASRPAKKRPKNPG